MEKQILFTFIPFPFSSSKVLQNRQQREDHRLVSAERHNALTNSLHSPGPTSGTRGHNQRIKCQLINIKSQLLHKSYRQRMKLSPTKCYLG
jgi:hypothetical protein